MDKDQNEFNGDTPQNINKNLSKATQIAFLAVICLLSFFSVVETVGILGTVFTLAAAAMNILLAIEFGKSIPKLLLLLSVNVIPFAAMFLYSGYLSVALLTLCPLALALPIYLTMRMGLGRTASIASAAIVCFLLFASHFALVIYNVYGALNIETIGTYIDEAFAPVADEFSKLTAEIDGKTQPLFTEQTLDELFYYTKTMLIGSSAMMMLVFAYLATLATRLLAGIFGVAHYLPTGLRVHVRAIMTADGPKVEVSREPVQWRIEIDSVTAWVYIAAYVASLLFAPIDGNVGIVYLALQNLVIILSPGFIYCALRDTVLMVRGKAQKGMLGRAMPILIVVLLFVDPSLVIMLFSILGVIVTIRENRAKKQALKNRKE
ncbi:MAG: hypothetical protein IJY93_01000 [Clostridia bacterium]|nr:hypothetical protein [Clostridia bacterium]